MCHSTDFVATDDLIKERLEELASYCDNVGSSGSGKSVYCIIRNNAICALYFNIRLSADWIICTWLPNN